LGSVAELLLGFLLNRVMNGIGIGKTVVLMGGSAVGALLVCGLMTQSRWALPAFMAADLLMDQLVFTIFPIINEVFYKLLPAEQRAGTSLLFAGSTSAIGKLLSSIITGLHSGGVVTITVFSMIGISMALWYLFLSLQQKRLYFSTLLESVRNHVVSVLELASFSPGKFLDKRDITPLREALQSTDANKQLIALEFGAKIKNEALIPLIKAFQTNPDPHKRLLAYQAMPDNLKGLEEICVRALQDAEPEIRCEAVQRLQCVVRDGRRLGEILKKHLSDSSPQVIREIMITLYHSDILDSDLDLKQQIHCQIEAMLGGDTENRVQVCRVIEAIKARQYMGKVIEMVEYQSSTRVRIAAVKCLGGLGSLEAVPWLLTNYSKADGELKRNIESALLEMGEGAVDLLLKGIDSNDVDIWYLCISILVSLDQERSFEKMLSRNCGVKLESWCGINEVPEILEKTGMTDLASLYRERSEEISTIILEACWKTLAIYFDPIIAGQLRQTFKEINSVEKREQGIEILNELSHKYPLTAKMVNVLHREPLSGRDQQLSFSEIMTRTKMEFSDYWLDIFSDYAIAHYREKSA
jgi:HEAT repeat protein